MHAAVEALRERCREAKEDLSSETEAVIPIALPSGFTTVRITRAELEQQIRPSIEATVRTLGQVIETANVSVADVDRILLVGGASRTPLVAELLSGAMGRPLVQWWRRDHRLHDHARVPLRRRHRGARDGQCRQHHVGIPRCRRAKLANSESGQSHVRWLISAKTSAGTGAQAQPIVIVPDVVGHTYDV